MRRSPSTRGWNIFERKRALPEQEHDLLRFRSIGQQAFEQFVKYRLLNEPSTEAPIRKKTLHTFTTTTLQMKIIKQTEKEKKNCTTFSETTIGMGSRKSYHTHK